VAFIDRHSHYLARCKQSATIGKKKTIREKNKVDGQRSAPSFAADVLTWTLQVSRSGKEITHLGICGTWNSG
jgi:hypothetical protein